MSDNKLSSLTLSGDSRFVRDLPSSEEDLTDDFLASYDRRTLFYDAFFDATCQKVVLVAPFLRKTLTRMLRNAVFEVDGVKSSPTITKVGGRTSQVDIDCFNPSPEVCQISHPRLPPLSELRINPSEAKRFAGLNAIVAVSKNNRLEWIRDWLRFHVKLHGANAVVLFDNGSDSYPIERLQRAVASVQGIKEYAVLPAPFPFGPVGRTRIHHNARFFQLSMLHLAQVRFLCLANAVLSVDVDELVLASNGLSVFEAAKKAPTGFLSISGSWLHALKPEDDRVIRHADHEYRRVGGDFGMSPKWCVDPKGPLKGEYWRLHGIANAMRDFSQGFSFLHCRQITTNWDYARDFKNESVLEKSPDASIVRRLLEND